MGVVIPLEEKSPEAGIARLLGLVAADDVADATVAFVLDGLLAGAISPVG